MSCSTILYVSTGARADTSFFVGISDLKYMPSDHLVAAQPVSVLFFGLAPILHQCFSKKCDSVCQDLDTTWYHPWENASQFGTLQSTLPQGPCSLVPLEYPPSAWSQHVRQYCVSPSSLYQHTLRQYRQSPSVRVGM